MEQPKTILITGASSGLGAALARHYAAPGIRLVLTGRNAEHLETVAAECREREATIVTALCDATDREAMQELVETQFAISPIDLMIANAGISAGPGHGYESASQTRQLFATNLEGVLNTALPALPLMRGRGRGQIALVSSLAGLRGLPTAPAYSASKVAVRALAEAWRPLCRKDGVIVSVVMPGFIRTPLTDRNHFAMPLLMEAEHAAAHIAQSLAKGKARIAFPLRLYAVAWLIAALPQAAGDFILSRLPSKGAESL